MSGNAIFILDRRPLFGFLVRQPDSIRFRICTEEWESLSLGQGNTVVVELCAGKAQELMVTSVANLDSGNTWVYLAHPIISRNRSTCTEPMRNVSR